MAYTQPKGQGSPAAKTGAGIPSALTMTGSPAKQNVTKKQTVNPGGIKRDFDGTAPLKPDGGSSYGNQLLGNIPAGRGKLYDRPDGVSVFPNNSSAGAIMDGDNDGDHILNDSNDDGTMLSRGFTSLVNAGKKIGNAISADFSDGGAEAKRKLRVDRGSIK